MSGMPSISSVVRTRDVVYSRYTRATFSIFAATGVVVEHDGLPGLDEVVELVGRSSARTRR